MFTDLQMYFIFLNEGKMLFQFTLHPLKEFTLRHIILIFKIISFFSKYTICMVITTVIVSLKLNAMLNAKYENPYQNSEKNSMYWSKVNVSNNGKKIIPHHARLFFKCHLVFRYLH